MFKKSLVNLFFIGLIFVAPYTHAEFKKDAQKNNAAVLLKASIYYMRCAAGTAVIIPATLLASGACFLMSAINVESFRDQLYKEAQYMARGDSYDERFSTRMYEDICNMSTTLTLGSAAVLICASAAGYLSYKYLLPSLEKQKTEKDQATVLASVCTATNLDN